MVSNLNASPLVSANPILTYVFQAHIGTRTKLPVYGGSVLGTPPASVVVLCRGTSGLVPQTVAGDDHGIVQEQDNHDDDDKRNYTPTDSQT